MSRAGWLACASVTSDSDPRVDRPHGAPIRTLGSQLSLPETQPRAPRPRPLSLLVTGGPLPGGLLLKDPAPQDDTSNLTHGNYPPLHKADPAAPQPQNRPSHPSSSGASRVLCGNPTKGLRERRHQCQVWLVTPKWVTTAVLPQGTRVLAWQCPGLQSLLARGPSLPNTLHSQMSPAFRVPPT